MAVDPTDLPEEEKPSEQRHVRPFAEWLVEAQQGTLASELSTSLNEVVEAVNLTGKPGVLTLKVSIKPPGKNADGGTVVVSADVATKIPVPDRKESVYFVDDDCNLSRHNPAQPALPLREVGKPVGSGREAQ
jgi:hypothetical protein